MSSNVYRRETIEHYQKKVRGPGFLIGMGNLVRPHIERHGICHYPDVSDENICIVPD
jgi:hypothetical protein